MIMPECLLSTHFNGFIKAIKPNPCLRQKIRYSTTVSPFCKSKCLI